MVSKEKNDYGWWWRWWLWWDEDEDAAGMHTMSSTITALGGDKNSTDQESNNLIAPTIKIMPFMLLLLMMNMKYEIWKWWIWNMNVKLQSCHTKTLRHHSVPRRSIAPRILWWPWRHRVGQLSRPELSHHLEVSSKLQAAKALKDLVSVQRMGWGNIWHMQWTWIEYDEYENAPEHLDVHGVFLSWFSHTQLFAFVS